MRLRLLAAAGFIIIALPGLAVPGASISQRVRSYDLAAGCNPNDPRCAIACETRLPARVQTVYVDVMPRGVGNVLDGVDLNNINAWEQDNARGPTDSFTYHQNVLIGTGAWRFYARFRSGPGVTCTVYR